jgi:hypothetical protein
MLVTVLATLLVRETAEPAASILSIYSPMLPAAAASLVVVPTMAGLEMVGDVPNTSAPEPVSLVIAEARLAELGVARKVATPVPRPARLAVGKPVVLVNVPADGVPRLGVTKTGLVAKTLAPVPVSSVRAAARFALLGVAKKVDTPVPRPLTPVVIGRPVVLVRVPEAGVPNTGAVKVGVVIVGDVANTLAPDPVVPADQVPAIVPEDVIGLPVTSMPAGKVTPTEETVLPYVKS